MGFSHPTDRLLFLVYADRTAAMAAIETARDVRHEYGLRGAPLLQQHIHSTIWHVHDGVSPPPDDLIAALAACANRVSMPAFQVSFDRVESFARSCCGERREWSALNCFTRSSRPSWASSARAGSCRT